MILKSDYYNTDSNLRNTNSNNTRNDNVWFS